MKKEEYEVSRRLFVDLGDGYEILEDDDDEDEDED